MADTSLDDFFAKKDKSKKSKTKKFTLTTSSEQMAKKPEDGKKPTQQQQQQQQNLEKTTKKDKEKVINTSTGSSTVQSSEQADDEWNEMEVEEEKDYSGLKIQNLQIGDLRDEEQDRDRSDDQSEDGDSMRNREGNGPWNKATNVVTPVVQKPIVPVVEKQEEKKTEGKYIPPGMRQDRTAASSSSGSRPKTKSAPKLDSEEHFPSLSASSEPKPSRKGAVSPDVSFEAVKRGGSRVGAEDVSNQSSRLLLGNKFDALSQGNES